MSDDTFLSRWSRRKTELKSSREPGSVPSQRPELPVASESAARSGAPMLQSAETTGLADPKADETAKPASDGGLSDSPSVPPPPTLADVALLTREDSYARFVAADVDPSVRNAAMKKLFTDPHYNVMDGLDIYIDDYGIPDPIPMAMLRRMTQSKSLGLFEREEAEEAEQERRRALAQAQSASPGPAKNKEEDAATLPSVAETTSDEDPDLQLQPDDGTRRAGAGPGTGDATES